MNSYFIRGENGKERVRKEGMKGKEKEPFFNLSTLPTHIHSVSAGVFRFVYLFVRLNI